jgi:hypothetical protein
VVVGRAQEVERGDEARQGERYAVPRQAVIEEHVQRHVGLLLLLLVVVVLIHVVCCW